MTVHCCLELLLLVIGNFHDNRPRSWDFRMDYALLKTKTYEALRTPLLRLLQILLLAIVGPILISKSGNNF